MLKRCSGYLYRPCRLYYLHVVDFSKEIFTFDLLGNTLKLSMRWSNMNIYHLMTILESGDRQWIHANTGTGYGNSRAISTSRTETVIMAININ